MGRLKGSKDSNQLSLNEEIAFKSEKIDSPNQKEGDGEGSKTNRINVKHRYNPSRFKSKTWKSWEAIHYNQEHGTNFHIITYYSGWPDISFSEHKYLKDNNDGRLAWGSYLAKSRGGAIDFHLVNQYQLKILKGTINRDDYYINIYKSDNLKGCDKGRNVLKENHIILKIANRFKGFAQDLEEITLSDVANHRDKPYSGKIPSGREKEGIFYVDELLPNTKARIINLKLKNIISSGKGASTGHKECPDKTSSQFMDGCISSMTPEGFFNPDEGGCTYCYIGKKLKVVGIKHLYYATRKEVAEAFENSGLKKSKPIFHRGAAVGESFLLPSIRSKFEISDDKYYLPEFLEGIVLAQENGFDIRFSVFSKYAEYDPYLLGLFKKTGTMVLSSTGRDDCEKGVCGWGQTTQKRLEDALSWKKHGHNLVGIAHVTDVRRGFDDMRDNDPLRDITSFCETNDLNLLFLSLKVKKHEDAQRFTGLSKESLMKLYLSQNVKGGKGQIDGFGLTGLGFRPRSNRNHSESVIQKIHPDFKAYVKDMKGKVGLCVSPGDEIACCDCFRVNKFKQKYSKGSYQVELTAEDHRKKIAKVETRLSDRNLSDGSWCENIKID